MSKQTAVEWLIEQLTPSISLQQKHIDELKEQAKEMEKQQIIDAYRDGRSDQQSQREARWYNRNAEYYYNETYGGE
jgi:HEPN domain-containing protein